MKDEYEFVDHLKEHMLNRAKKYVENIGAHYPPELLKLKNKSPDRLIDLIAEGATPILRKLEDDACIRAAMDLTIGIRWAEHQKSRR